MDDPQAAAPPPPIRLRTPHLAAMLSALAARDHRYEVVGPDVVRVHEVAADDLGWLAATSGVVIYEMTDDPGAPGTTATAGSASAGD